MLMEGFNMKEKMLVALHASNLLAGSLDWGFMLVNRKPFQYDTTFSSPIHSFIHTFVPSFLRSFIRSFVRSFLHSFFHSFISSFSRAKKKKQNKYQKKLTLILFPLFQTTGSPSGGAEDPHLRRLAGGEDGRGGEA